jgi:hypothetical protein
MIHFVRNLPNIRANDYCLSRPRPFHDYNGNLNVILERRQSPGFIIT